MSKKEAPAKETEETKPAEGEVIEGGAAKKGKKKLVIIAAAAVLLIGGGAGAFFSGAFGGKKDEAATEEAAGEHGEAAKEEGGHGGGGGHGEKEGAPVVTGPVYYELPQFLVNLNSSTGRASFLKMSVTLELRDAAAVNAMNASKPRIVDTFNTYLRELRPSDIQGSAGIYHLRTELMTRLNSTIEEGIVKDILFGEIIVQ